MKRVVYLFFCMSIATFLQASSYWLIQEDFIKIGKKDLYETEKTSSLQKEMKKTIGFADLDNPQYVFLMPLQKLSSLESYPPFSSVSDSVLLKTSLHFQIFSLHSLVEEASLCFDEFFNRPYVFYALYDIEMEASEAFEKHIQEKKEAFSKASWGLWKSMIAGVYPKYLFCISFITKEELMKWSMDQVLSGLDISHVLKNKQEGKLRQDKELSYK